MHPIRYDLAALRRDARPFRLVWRATVGSTNTRALALRRAGQLVAPCVVVAGRQTAGRGRGANQWHSPPGVITASFVVPCRDGLPPALVPLAAGLAVAEAADALGVEGVGLKWPNDVWVGGRKLAGLLCERAGGVDVIGVGFNACADVGALPGDLHAWSAGVSVNAAVAALAGAFDRWLLRGDAPDGDAVVRAFRKRCVLTGLKVRVTNDGEPPLIGACRGIDAHGRLLVDANGERHRVFAGHVRPA